MIRTALLVLSLLTWTSASVFDADVDVQQPQSAFFQPCDTDLAHPHDVTYQPNIQHELLADPVSSSYDNNQVWRDRSMTDVVESSSSNVEIDDASSQSEPSHKPMHLMQASQMFTMERLTARAPWSTRIQPALQYRQNTIRYTQRGTGIVINAAANSLHMFEGGFTQDFNGTNMIENDIWISQGGSDGRTWDLIAGRSLFGVSGDVNASHTRTFTGRRGSNSCADPKSDIVLSLAGGNPVSGNNTNEVWYSSNGFDWIQKSRGATFSPPRHFCSCDIDEMGHAFVIGGQAHNDSTGMDYLLDDIWMTNVLWPYNSFTRVTEHAPFGPREEHLVLVINSTALKTELIYVIGGKVSCNVGSANCYDGTNANDVWVSSDYAKSWIKLPTTPWGPRWGHTGLVTNDGVLLVIGGLDSLTSRYTDMYTHQDIWASFDGGISWKQCMTNETGWIRGESSVVINPRGQMIATSGYFYAGSSQTRYNDVWRSTFSVEDTSELAKRCGGMSVIPAAGPGMTRWPGSTPDTNIISFTPLTRRAPWSPRIQPAMFLQNNPRTYVNPNDGSTASTGPDWLLMFEGSLTADGQNENDVYASANNGNDWVLISGIAQRGLAGRTESASPHTSFESRGAAGNCENPTNDDVYSLAGTKTWPNGTTEYTTDVWYSSDAIIWTKRPVTSRHYSPGRYFTSCDIDNKGLIYLIGGQTASGFLNDIWTSSNAGVSWNLITRAAKFAPRSEHAVQIVHSDHYKKDIVYVIGGFTTGGVLNDVWVSSNSKDWKQIRSTKTAFSPRWGHTALVTNRGMLIVAGGTDGAYISPEDFWVSLNGGKDWTSCNLAVNGGIIRGEQAAVLTYDEKILIGNGYKYSPGFRTEYSDLWISDMSFKDPKSQALRSACPRLVVPSTIGYIDSNWEPVDPDGPDDDSSTGDFEESSTGSSGTSSSGGLSTTVIIAIIVVVVLVLGGGLYVYRHHTQTGSWNPFSSEPPRHVGNIIDTSALFAGQDSSSSSLPASQTRTDSSSTQMSNF